MNVGVVNAAWMIVAALLKLVAAVSTIAPEVIGVPLTSSVRVPVSAFSCVRVSPETLPPRR